MIEEVRLYSMINDINCNSKTAEYGRLLHTDINNNLITSNGETIAHVLDCEGYNYQLREGHAYSEHKNKFFGVGEEVRINIESDTAIQHYNTIASRNIISGERYIEAFQRYKSLFREHQEMRNEIRQKYDTRSDGYQAALKQLKKSYANFLKETEIEFSKECEKLPKLVSLEDLLLSS